MGLLKKKPKKPLPEFDPKDYQEPEDEEEVVEENEEEGVEEGEEDEDRPTPPRRPKKVAKQEPAPKPTLQDVLVSHEQRLQALESWAFRVKAS